LWGKAGVNSDIDKINRLIFSVSPLTLLAQVNIDPDEN
jgi:hypothetical protein